MKKYITSILLITLLNLGGYGQRYDVTVFGTSLLNQETIEDKYQNKLSQLAELYESRAENYSDEIKAFNQSLKKENQEFCYVNTQFFKSYVGKLDLIIDIVENADSASRLNYRSIITTSTDTPQDLIDLWYEYEDTSYELFKEGEIKDMNCPVIHCLWSFNHPKLAPYLPKLNEGASEHKNELINTIHHDPNKDHRAAAAFLLSHAGLSESELLSVLMPAIHDPESVVRNNAMRVIYYIARANPDLDYDIPTIVNALDHPSFTDRNKALVILRSIPLDNIDQSTKTKLAAILLEILIKKDAHNYRNAHRVIKNLSGLDYGEGNIVKWKEWVETI